MGGDVESKGDIVQQSDVGSDVAEKPKCSDYEIKSHVGSDKFATKKNNESSGTEDSSKDS